jgi:hypothetical protein
MGGQDSGIILKACLVEVLGTQLSVGTLTWVMCHFEGPQFLNEVKSLKKTQNVMAVLALTVKWTLNSAQHFIL